jgi:uncharacterized protein
VSIVEIVGFSLALLVMCIGLLGTILPMIPGSPIVLAAAILHRLYFGPNGANIWVLVLLGLLVLLSMGLEYLATSVGAKRLGGSWKGMLGAVIGGIVGLFFNLPGVLLGPFIGAFLFELIGDYEYKRALRAGAGATLGLLIGAVGKFSVCVVMIALFSANVLYRLLG